MTDRETKLENIVKQMLTPLKSIPLDLVIDAISGHKIIPFDWEDYKDLKTLDLLKKVAIKAGENANIFGIVRPRPNEVGNDMENFVKDAFGDLGFFSSIPSTKNGKEQSTGYPDLQFIDQFGRTNYLECKTFNIKNLSTTQRSFYLSPSENFKVTTDAHHFILSFEIIETGEQGKNHIYKCNSRKILSIENLDVDVKYEFNSSNAKMYSKELIIAEGTIDSNHHIFITPKGIMKDIVSG